MARKKNVKVTDTQLTKPQTRLERYLGTIAGLFSNAPTDPRTRLERYLDAIVRGGVPITPGTPTSVEGLLYGNSEGKVEGILPDLTAEEIAARIEAAQLISEFPRPNLLDNPYFVGGGSQQGGSQFPINQRAGWIIKPGSLYYDSMWSGEHVSTGYYTATDLGGNSWSVVIDGTTYYTTNGEATNVFPGYSGVGYGIDRWWWWNRTEYSLVKSGLRLNGDKYMAQKIAPSLSKSLLGQVVTMSCLTDTECIWKTFAWSEQTNGVLIGEGVEIRAGGSIPGFGINYPIFVINTATAPQTIKAVKLELGDTQTLAHQENGVWVLNEIPKYDEELRACQRYQVVLDSVAGSPIGTTVKPGSNGALIIPLPIVMRTSSPEYSVDGVFRASGDGFYADLPSTAFDNEWIRIVNGFCVIGLKIPVNNGCLVDTASTARLIIDANL